MLYRYTQDILFQVNTFQKILPRSRVENLKMIFNYCLILLFLLSINILLTFLFFLLVPNQILEISREDVVLQVNGLVNGDVYHVSGDCDVCAWSILIYYARLGCTVFFRTLMITTGYEVRLSTTEKRQQNLSELEILKGFPIIEFSIKTFTLRV